MKLPNETAGLVRIGASWALPGFINARGVSTEVANQKLRLFITDPKPDLPYTAGSYSDIGAFLVNKEQLFPRFAECFLGYKSDVQPLIVENNRPQIVLATRFSFAFLICVKWVAYISEPKLSPCCVLTLSFD
jgi:hypothetical protein